MSEGERELDKEREFEKEEDLEVEGVGVKDGVWEAVAARRSLILRKKAEPVLGQAGVAPTRIIRGEGESRN